MDGCVFCAIIAGTETADLIYTWSDAIAIRPLNPVTSGHVLVIPRDHVTDVGSNPQISGQTAARAAELARHMNAANIITSKGAYATQTVHHLHWHVVPRTAGDGLPLPWTPATHSHREG